MTTWIAAVIVIGVPLATCIVFLIVDRKWSGKWWWDN